MQSHYDVLELPINASKEDIRQSYRRLILLHHPDKNSKLDGFAEKLNTAYGVLCDDEKRREYDELLRGE